MQRLFQGFIVYGLRPKGKLLEDLKAVGFDASNILPTYPIFTFYETLRVAAEAHYPELTRPKAEHLLAAKMINGLTTTLLGRFIPGMMPFLNADSMCVRLPKYFPLGVLGQVQPASVVRLAERHYETTIHDLNGMAHLTTGLVHALMSTMKVSPIVKLTRCEERAFVFETSWVAV